MENTSVGLMSGLADTANEKRFEDSWTKFVRLYTKPLIGWAKRHGLEQTLAEDLVQEVFITLFRKIKERKFVYDQDLRLRSWLGVVVRYTASDLRKHGGRWVSCEFLDQLPHFIDSQHEESLRAIALQRLQASKSESDGDWLIFRAVIVEGRSRDDVCMERGISKDAVYSATRRIRKEAETLLEKIEREFDAN